MAETEIRKCAVCDIEMVCYKNLSRKTCSGKCKRYNSLHPGQKRPVPVLLDGHKLCSRCGFVKPLEAFAIRRASPDGKQGQCRECSQKWQDANRAARQKTWAAYAKNKRYSKYGVTADYIETYVRNINGKCEICRVDLTSGSGGAGMVVDHDHKTGMFRGVLCASCNKALGCLKDDVDILVAAIEYLKLCPR